MNTTLGDCKKVTFKCSNIGTTLPSDYVNKTVDRVETEGYFDYRRRVFDMAEHLIEKYDSVEIFKHTNND